MGLIFNAMTSTNQIFQTQLWQKYKGTNLKLNFKIQSDEIKQNLQTKLLKNEDEEYTVDKINKKLNFTKLVFKMSKRSKRWRFYNFIWNWTTRRISWIFW